MKYVLFIVGSFSVPAANANQGGGDDGGKNFTDYLALYIFEILYRRQL